MSAAVDITILPKLGQKYLKRCYISDKYNSRPNRQQEREFLPVPADQVVLRIAPKAHSTSPRQTPTNSFVDLNANILPPKSVQFTGMDVMRFYDEEVPTNHLNK